MGPMFQKMQNSHLSTSLLVMNVYSNTAGNWKYKCFSVNTAGNWKYIFFFCESLFTTRV